MNRLIQRQITGAGWAAAAAAAAAVVTPSQSHFAVAESDLMTRSPTVKSSTPADATTMPPAELTGSDAAADS